MTSRTHRKIFGATAVVAALLLASCGTSGGSDAADKGDDEKVTTTTEAEETTTTEAEFDEEAMARAETIDLTLSDFPDGWEAAPHEEDDSEGGIEDCDPNLADDSTHLAEYNTDDFTVGAVETGDAVQVTASTVVFTDEDAAVEALDSFSDPEFISCVDSTLKELFGDGTDATVEGSMEEDDIELDADQTEGISGTYTITADSDGSTATTNVGLLVMRTGDIATLVSILSFGDTFDPTTLQDPILKIVELQAEA